MTAVLLHKEGVLLIEIIPRDFQRFAESLEVYDFPFPQETQRGKHFRVIRQVDQVFIGTAGLLLCRTFVNTTFCDIFTAAGGFRGKR